MTGIYSWSLATAGRRAGAGESISGLEWDGNEETNTQRVLRWLSPFAIYDATFIFRVYPKGPKNGTNPYYWTTFFWGNYGDFDWNAGNAGTYYGAHPYPFDGPSATTNQDWEISIYSNDYTDGVNITWNRWYTQAFRAWRQSASITNHEFYYDWDLWVSSGGTQGMFSQQVNDAAWAASNPPTPSIVVGEAPPNNANTASWGGFIGREQFKGIIRGMQFYDALLTTGNITSELAAPGSVRTPWYLNINPTPDDVQDKSGSGHHPSFPSGNKPTLWIP